MCGAKLFAHFNLGGFVSRCCKRSRRPQFPMGLIFGLALICLGIAFLLNNLHIIYIEDALMFSPLVLIAWGLARLWNKGILNVWGHILVVTGVLLQIVFLQTVPLSEGQFRSNR